MIHIIFHKRATSILRLQLEIWDYNEKNETTMEGIIPYQYYICS